jgi:hypothetical protein
VQTRKGVRSSHKTLARDIDHGLHVVRSLRSPQDPGANLFGHRRHYVSLCVKAYRSVLIRAVRPTTFWRKTRKSGVSGPSYSPSTHLIRRSTYIAAGLSFDAPIHDLSALCVESRVGFLVIPPATELL